MINNRPPALTWPTCAPTINMSTSDHVKEYYTATWGRPSRTANYATEGVNIDIFKWNADSHPDGVAFYATIGLSNHKLNGYEKNHRMEFLIGFLPEEDRIVEPLASLVAKIILKNLEMGHSHTMTFDEPLWEGAKMRTLIIRRPKTEIIPNLKVSEDRHVEFMQAIPLFPSELSIKQEKGAESLFNMWREKNVPFWNPGRLPSI